MLVLVLILMFVLGIHHKVPVSFYYIEYPEVVQNVLILVLSTKNHEIVEVAEHHMAMSGGRDVTLIRGCICP